MSFSEISMSYYSTLRHWKQETGIPTEPTGPPVYQQTHLDEVQAGVAPQLAKKNIYVIQAKKSMFCRPVPYG